MIWNTEEITRFVSNSWQTVVSEKKMEHLFLSTSEGEYPPIPPEKTPEGMDPDTQFFRTEIPAGYLHQPYAPFLDLIEKYCAGRPGFCLKNIPGIYPPHREILEGYLHDRTTRRDENVIPEELQYEKIRMQDSILRCLMAICNGPAIIRIDGIHNAGRSSLEFIEYLTEQTERAPILFIFTFERMHRFHEEENTRQWDFFLSRFEDRNFVIETGNRNDRQDTDAAPPGYTDPETITALAQNCFNFLAFHECRQLCVNLYDKLQNPEMETASGIMFRLLHLLGDIHIHFGDEDASLLYFNVLLNLAREKNNTREVACTCRKMADIYIDKKNRETSRKFIEQSLHLARSLNDDILIFECHFTKFRFLETFHSVTLSEITDFNNHIEKTVALGEQLNRLNTVAYLLEKSAFQALSLNAVKGKTKSIYKKAMAIAEKNGNLYRLSALYGGMGVFESIIEQPSRAFRAYARSLKLKQQIGESKEAAKSYNSIGYLCYLTGDYVKSVKYYSRAISLLKDVMDFNEVTMTLFNMVQSFFYARSYTLALEYAELVIEMTSMLEMKALPMSSLTEVFSLAALAALRTGDMRKCLRYHARIEKNSSGNDEYYCQLLRAQLSRERGEFRESEAFFKRIINALNDKDKPFFMKNYPVHFSIPYYYEYGTMLLEKKDAAGAGECFQKGIEACEAVGHNFYKELMQAQIEKRLPSRIELDFSGYLIDTSFLLALTSQQSRFLTQESNLNKLHKKINEINFLNNLQNILSRNSRREELIREVMEFIHHSLLIELSAVFLEGKKSWRPVYTSRPIAELPFHISKLQINMLKDHPEILIPSVADDPNFSFLDTKIHSLMSVQLTLKSKVIGAIACATRENRLSFSRDDLRILNIVAKQLSGALQRIDLIEQLREMDRIKTQFFTNVSHETKTPLTLIGNYIEKYIQTHGSSEELEIIRQNIIKLQRDMVNFLDGEKLRKGQIFYNHNQHLDLSDLLSRKTLLFREIAATRRIELSGSIEEGCFIKADPFAVDRIINNLIDNAIKYTLENGTVGIILKRDKDRAVLEVTDTGIGISPKQQKHIFELYHQISHRKRNLQGIGMGLYLVKMITESLHGSITVSSAESRGSTFRVTIPLSQAPAQEKRAHDFSIPAPFGRTAAAPPEQKHNPDRDTLLLVEDNENLLYFIQSSLAGQYNAYFTLNGREALKKLETIPKPGVIISDVMMDEMDGFTFFEALREDSRFRDIPVIFLSAKTDMEDRLQGLHHGAIDYIPKPFRMEELEAKIASILRFTTVKQHVSEMDKLASIGRLVAGISHEIFNPLSAIIGPLEFIEQTMESLQGYDKETVGNAFRHINNSVNRIESIIRSLKTLYYKSSLEKSQTDIHAIAESILTFLKGKSNSGITFQNSIPEKFTVCANHEALTRILMNLLSNGADAISGRGEVSIFAAKKDSFNTITVRDTGSGIPAADREKIFDLFFTTKSPGKGTGLGLHLVKELCVKMGWDIRVFSEEGQGTEFILKIPYQPPAI